ncbi:MAG: UvrD-helicase domain-containing protein [Chthoniobacterales bacterium]|nr:UvrD-helicase domain-containing protein [Chthoniobacterales bacterium]
MKRRQFDLIETPLEEGRTLIEASAGTGKTYTIAGIVLRLILEKDFLVKEILVTTYTELATEELRDRIRRLLRDTLTAFKFGSLSADQPNELITALLQRVDSNLALRRLDLALQTFDEAPIYTIHGFCQRMLQDHAFESAGLFDRELIRDQTHILGEIVDDFWRAHFYYGDPILAGLKDSDLKPQKLLNLLIGLTNNPTLVVEPDTGEQFEELTREYGDLSQTKDVSQEQLETTRERLVVCAQAKFLAWARAEMKRRKEGQNLLSFDDMLTRLHESLGGEGGAELAGRIRSQFKAALVDEFQDTDPIQYAIFARVYDGGGSVFFIGDPKQAIYGFRGADVFTYIDAAQSTPPAHQFTLGKNWRAEAGLVDAVNTVFSVRENPFVFEQIGFARAQAAGKADNTPLTLESVRRPPLQVWRALAAKPLTVPEADELLLRAVPGEIARLLNSNSRIGEEKVEPKHIAVLVRRNVEAQMMQEALTKAGIPSVLYAGANVFKSDEAHDLERILTAVVEPAHERLVKAALTTEMLGLTGEALEALTRDETAWEERLLRFQTYHLRWQERGFIQMLRSVVLQEKVRERLLSFPNGERRLTNLLHLAELLHGLCQESRLGMTGLLKRLGEQIRERNAAREEEYELRLERDEKAVRIVTVHRSKGLEYDIVFCPYTWRSKELKKDDDVIFHRDDRLTLDLDKSEDHRSAQRRERLAEELRLFYVALTRARHRCYFVCGSFRNADESAPGYLLGGGPNDPLTVPASVLENVAGIDLVDLTTITPEKFRPPPESNVSLSARSFDRSLDRSYGISSFTRLISGHAAEPATADEDALELEEAEPEVTVIAATSERTIFDFPRGMGPGTCLHHILEETTFSDLSQLGDTVSGRLRAFGIEEFENVVRQMIERVANVSLEKGMTLGGIDRRMQLPELEFYFPLGEVRREPLVKLLGDKRLQFQPLSGFMKGFIDLVFEHEGRFYLVDWKSNWLGPDPESYSLAAMETEMERKFYHLQLSIYTVALHRFLRGRRPGYEYDKHFGGSYYLFLRGIEPTRPDLGIYRKRLTLKFVQQLDLLLQSNP